MEAFVHAVRVVYFKIRTSVPYLSRMAVLTCGQASLEMVKGGETNKTLEKWMEGEREREGERAKEKRQVW